MLQINPEKVCFIIAKAREFEAQEAVVEDNPGSNPSDDDFRSILASYPDDSTYEEIKAFIDALNVDEQAELVALAWLGRDDYSPAEWNQALNDAADRHTGPTSTYLLGIPLLPDYLENALGQFAYSCADLES